MRVRDRTSCNAVAVISDATVTRPETLHCDSVRLNSSLHSQRIGCPAHICSTCTIIHPTISALIYGICKPLLLRFHFNYFVRGYPE